MYRVRVQKAIASPGRGILAMDESNATCGLRLASIGLENTEVNRQAYRQLLVGTPGLGEYVSGAILFEETLYQSTTDGNKMVDVLTQAGIVPGIKVDKVWSHYTDTQNSSSSLLKHCTTTTRPLDSLSLSLCALELELNIVLLLVWNFAFFPRVLFLWLDLTTSHGAKALMVLHQGQLLTTSRELDLRSGKPANPLISLLIAYRSKEVFLLWWWWWWW